MSLDDLCAALIDLKREHQEIADRHEEETHMSASEVVYLVERLLFELKLIEIRALDGCKLP